MPGARSGVGFSDFVGGVLVKADTVLFKECIQLAGQCHLGHDIAAADKFALNVELRDCWPVGIILDPLACLLYTSPSPRDATLSRMPSSA